MTTTFRHAAQVKRIAEELIPKHHDELADFNVEIRYLFRSDAKSKNGRTVLATASKVGGRNALLASSAHTSEFPQLPSEHEFFVLEVAEDQWAHLTDKQRRALVDHELMHMGVFEDPKTGEPKLTMRGHDLEEFRSIIERHGLWKEDVEQMSVSFDRAIQQMALDGLEEGE